MSTKALPTAEEVTATIRSMKEPPHWIRCARAMCGHRSEVYLFAGDHEVRCPKCGGTTRYHVPETLFVTYD